MDKRRTLEEKVSLRVSLKKGSVFVRNEFSDLGGYDQVGRVLRQLVAKKKLIKIGYGLYAKAKISQISGKLIPQVPLPNLAREALTKLGVKTATPTPNRTMPTQVPTGRMIAVQSRISRKIGYGGTYIDYERTTR
jgi:Family of unknown function (DUF6088)